jgi:hypothetical protein
MKNIEELLFEEAYRKIPFKLLKTHHLQIKVKINGITGIFILDTGASNSCIGFESVDYFKLKTKKSKTKAAGAGAINMHAEISKKNTLKIGKWYDDNFTLVVFDLSHVNEALTSQNVKPIHGIIGADVLLKGKAIIDYSGRYLFLK